VSVFFVQGGTMKKHFQALLLVLLISPTLMVSCGGGGGGGGGKDTTKTPSDNEDDDNGSGGSSCLTTNQQNNITNLFNTLSSDGSMLGDTTATVYNPDGTVDEGTFDATGFRFARASSTSWGIGYALCTSPDDCRSSASTAGFQNGCFFVNGLQARINSSSSSSLNITTVNQDGTRIVADYNRSSSGIFRYSETYFDNGRRAVRLSFIERNTTVARESLVQILKLNSGKEANMSEVVPLEQITR
jgi:hypothetical protein